jgi:hypothetical protein
MSRYDELVSIYLKAKDEYEHDGRMCRDFAHDLMKAIFRAFDCPSGIMMRDSRRDHEGFWENTFWLMIVPNFPSSLAVKKSDGHFIVKFESDDTQFIIKDIESENLESFYHFVFERWKEKLAQYFQARPEVDEQRESGQYL